MLYSIRKYCNHISKHAFEAQLHDSRYLIRKPLANEVLTESPQPFSVLRVKSIFCCFIIMNLVSYKIRSIVFYTLPINISCHSHHIEGGEGGLLSILGSYAATISVAAPWVSVLQFKPGS